MTVSGSVFSSRNAASAQAGAVFLAAGSLRMCSRGTSGSCSTIRSSRRSLVITQTSAGSATGVSRSTVCWIIVRSPSRASTCFARALRLRGQNRVPLPPARITGANFRSALLPSIGISLQLTQRCEVVPHPLHAFIDNIVRNGVRQPDMFHRSERLARHNDNMRLTQQLRRQIGRRLDATLANELAHIRIHIKRALPHSATQPRDGLETRQYLVSQLDIVGAKLCQTFLRSGQRGDRSTLHHARGVRCALRLQLAHRSNHRLGTKRKTRSPARHRIALRERTEHNDMLLAVREGATANDLTSKVQVDITLVEQHEDAVLMREPDNRLKILRRHNSARRIRRRIQNDSLRLRRDRRLNHLRGNAEVLFLFALDQNNFTAGAFADVL